MKRCPGCEMKFEDWDDIAVHLIDKHFWDYEKARDWLMDKVEAGLAW